MLLQTLWQAAKSWVGLSEKVPDTSGLGLQNPVLLEIFPKIYPVIHILFMKPHIKCILWSWLMTYVELSLQAGLSVPIPRICPLSWIVTFWNDQPPPNDQTRQRSCLHLHRSPKYPGNKNKQTQLFSTSIPMAKHDIGGLSYLHHQSIISPFPQKCWWYPHDIYIPRLRC